MPGLTTANGTVLAEAASVCFEHQAHKSGVKLVIDGDSPGQMEVNWDQVTEQRRRTYADLQEATEWGASGVAIVIICMHTGRIVVERSRKGGGFDYWLGKEDDGNLFQNKARLEVSGILKGDLAKIEARLRQKVEQVSPSNGSGTPVYISIVEFGEPRARMVTKK